MKVMVVDDDRALRKILSKTIEKWGYETITASDGLEALEHLRSNDPPRLMVLDIMMPNLNGIEVCKQLNTLGKQLIYTIILTAVSSGENLIATLEAGAHDFLAKPVDMKELKCRIEVGARLIKSEDSARKNQLFLEAATEGANLGLWELDLSNHMLTVNKRIKDLIGLEVGYNLSVEQWYKLVHPDDLALVKDRVENKFATLSDSYTAQYRIASYSHNWSWVRMSGRAIKAGTENTNIKICGIMQDITREKEEENQLFESIRLSAVLSLAGGVAHNFNNLNAGITGYLQLAMRDEMLSEKTQQRINTAMDSLDEVTRITESLLRFSGLHYESASNEVDLHLVITDIMVLLKEKFETKDINFTLQIDSAPVIEGDPASISQAIFNIIENSYHALQGCPHKNLRISCYPEDHEAVLVIADTGMGLKAEYQEKVFTPFFTTKGEHAEENSSQAGFKGLGLGLPLAKNIINRHKGSISIKSNGLDGTKVTIHLPISQPKNSAQEFSTDFQQASPV